MSAESQTKLASMDVLDQDHQRALERALKRILQTEIAEHTYAEILDGLPTRASFYDLFWHQEGHPAIDHVELYPGVRERACEFRSKFDLSALRFSSSLLLAFQETLPASKSFHLRLIELLAVSCHQIGAYLFRLDGAIHKHEEYERWRDEPRDMDRWNSYRHPTAFSYGYYVETEQYPDGVADVVGYWAEGRIFGGIVVFDRGETETESKDVFIHGCRRRGPRTIYPPTAEQFDDLIRFLLDKRDESTIYKCPLPMYTTPQNRWRWDPWDAIARFHIFRDRYERPVGEKEHSDVKNAIDWPEITDELFLINVMWDRKEGIHVDENEVLAAKERIQMITPSSPVWVDMPSYLLI